MTLDGRRIGKIRLIEKLGKGGMGEVFLGYDEKLERHVAVKAITGLKRLDAEAKERFLREAKLLSKLEHPSICRIYDFIEGPNADFLVLELIRGKAMPEAMRAGLNHATKMKIAILTDEALAAAHSQSIVHRDLKPDNVMLTDDGRVKVLDFGLARAVGERDEAAANSEDGEEESVVELQDGQSITIFAPRHDTQDGGYKTEHGVIMGTPMYMSPEQARGEAAKPASDMYSFGLFLQWLFTEKQPYAEGLWSYALIKKAICGETLPVTGIDPDLITLINRLKTVSPQTRPTAVDTLTQLKWIQDKPKKRFRRIVTMAFVFLLSMIAVLASLGYLGIKRAKDATEAALDQAERARREAERTRDQVVAVNEFLQDMLSSANPAKQGPDIKVIDLLAQASQKADEELADDPESRAAIHATLCETYLGLGDYATARIHAERAFATRRKILGDEHPSTLMSMNMLALVLKELDEFEEAERIHRQALELSRRVLGETHPLTLEIMNHLALVAKRQGKNAEAETFFRQTWEARKKLLGERHPDTMSCLGNLALTLDAQGKFAQAEELHRLVLAAQKDTLGPNDHRTLLSMNMLGISLRSHGKYAEAEEIHREALPILERVFGEDHPKTMNCLNNLGVVLASQGKLEEAEATHRRALAVRTRVLGEDHSHTLGSMFNLASVLDAQGKHEEAEALHRHVLHARMELLGEDHPSTLKSMNNLAQTLDALGRHEEAERFNRRTLELRRRVLGEPHAHTLLSMTNLMISLLAQGKREDAVELFSKIENVLPDVRLDDYTANSLVVMGQAMAQHGFADQARIAFQAAAESGHPRARQILDRQE